MKVIRIVLALLLSLVYGKMTVFAQNADTAKLSPKFRFDVSGGFYTQIHGNTEPQAVLPDYLKVRRPQEPQLAKRWGLNDNKLPDSPLGHGASYFTFHTWVNITPGLELYGSFTADHRGFSFAPYNTTAIAFLARYHAQYTKAVPFFKSKDSLKVFGRIGTREDYRNNEGLTLYNIDMQGLEGSLQWRKLKLSTVRVTDLQFGIGLNIDGVIDYKLGMADVKLGKNWQAEAGIGRQKYESRLDEDGVKYITLAAHSRHTRWYAEAGYRNSGLDVAPALNIAFLAGVRGKAGNDKSHLKYSVEYRYYGGGFNHSLHKETLTHYRDTAQSAGHNFVGTNVYPLSFLNRPFGQWAVFTEYGKQWVGGFAVTAQWQRKLYKNLYLLVDLDMNLIRAQGETPFVYPFYKTGVMFEAVKGNYLAATLTNKTMNLDKHYTTYYLMDRPVFQFELRRDINL